MTPQSVCKGVQRAARVTELLGFAPHCSVGSDVVIGVLLRVTDPLCSFVLVQMSLSHNLTLVTTFCGFQESLGWGREMEKQWVGKWKYTDQGPLG